MTIRIRQADPAAVLAATRAQMVCTPRQARLAMVQTPYAGAAHLLAAVEGIIATQGDLTRIAWEYATEFQRNDPMINALAPALGLTDTDLDALFVRAMAI